MLTGGRQLEPSPDRDGNNTIIQEGVSIVDVLEVGEKDLYSFKQTFQGLQLFKAIDPAYYREIKELFERTRRFAREEAAPRSLDVDRELQRDPANKEPVWQLARLCGREGHFSLTAPRKYGGGGFPLFVGAMLLEELCAACAGMGNIVGAHYLGYLGIYGSMKLRLFERICREIVAAEKSEKPVILAAALTEPLSGSDNFEAELLPGAHIQSEAKKVPGGYVLNGTKCFISNGSISTYHTAMMPQDRRRPLDTFTTFLVPTDTRGFSFGRDEHKMGQKGCPASVMIYEDCFIPEEYCLGTSDAGGTERMLDLMGLTRLCVGAIATGVARGAYERAVTFAREHRARGKPLIGQQWAQMILSQMLMNVMTARATYMEANYCDLLWGTGKAVPLRRGGFRTKQFVDNLLGTEMAKRFTDREENLKRIMSWGMEHSGMDTSLEASYGAWAKAKCSDYAMINAGLGVDIMGKAGLRHDRGMEKIFRDAKLLQIYEGTNEHCRQALFNRYIGRREPGAEVFGRDAG